MVQKTTSLPMAFTEVDDENIQSLVAPILDTIRQAQYIAVDTEFSGHCPTIAKHMDQRYRALSEVIRSHTLFSFGLTAICTQSSNGTETYQQSQAISYQFNNLEFLTHNQNTFQVDPNNIKFLAENGFDFGRIFQHGIPFCSGTLVRDNNNSSSSSNNNINSNSNNNVLRRLWHDIIQIIRDKNIPIIIHNGLLDIMYIYQSFIASLPDNLSNFVADLVEMFPAGIYDTKYLATAVANESKSFLAYLYCKYRRLHQQDNSTNGKWNTVVLPPLSPSSPSSPSPPSITTADKKASRPIDSSNDTPAMKRRKRSKRFVGKKESKTGICGHYSQHGWCKLGKKCNLSHDLEIILDHDLGTQQQTDAENTNDKDQHSTTQQSNDTDENFLSTVTTQIGNTDDDSKFAPRRDHSAHFDAYMTAFVFCHFLTTLPPDELSTHINKLNLMRMEIPLRLEKSHYAKPSAEWTRIKSQLWPSL